ncbi:hypothetical protein [Shewanella sp. FJAT-52076]|uniref:hypothetical protein n=1 Tax=Shewanella sp. FJAT-52076 TaxID=2864202 RepID=UPI001C65AE4A|nr:hypothetical protein [Shewanella sp. FJAT-52076]QYJ74647.1 hypothetical protein K0H79_15015 [Shewanella sp. FJAT-52076]
MKGTVQYFNIEKLGIYKRASEEQLFDSAEAILDSLIEWVRGRPQTVNTSTRKADKGRGQSNVYCCDADGASGEYVFVLWNEMTNAEDEILTLSKDSKPGEVKVKPGVNSKEVIPGLPSYYWISLNHGLVATIHFDHAITSIAALKNYITSYVHNYSEFAITEEGDDNKVVGFSHPHSEEAKGYFKFELKRKIDESTVEELTQNYKRITKVVRRAQKSVEDVELQGFFSKLGSKQIGRGLPKGRQALVEVEIEFTPATEKDFKDIVRAYEREILDPDKYNNLGFVLKGEHGKKVFLDGKVLRTEHDFDIIRKKKNPFGAGELLEYIGRKQVRFVPKGRVKEVA